MPAQKEKEKGPRIDDSKRKDVAGGGGGEHMCLEWDEM